MAIVRLLRTGLLSYGFFLIKRLEIITNIFGCAVNHIICPLRDIPSIQYSYNNINFLFLKYWDHFIPIGQYRRTTKNVKPPYTLFCKHNVFQLHLLLKNQNNRRLLRAIYYREDSASKIQDQLFCCCLIRCFNVSKVPIS